ncbi:MAG: transporter, partial [Burkholderiales bacterium]|nr:transporter [Burkholderiales bacterium]
MTGRFRKATIVAAFAGVCSGATTGAHSAGFALIEQSASGQGNAYAGAA